MCKEHGLRHLLSLTLVRHFYQNIPGRSWHLGPHEVRTVWSCISSRFRDNGPKPIGVTTLTLTALFYGLLLRVRLSLSKTIPVGFLGWRYSSATNKVWEEFRGQPAHSRPWGNFFGSATNPGLHRFFAASTIWRNDLPKPASKFHGSVHSGSKGVSVWSLKILKQLRYLCLNGKTQS